MIELKDVIHYYLGCRVMVAPFGGQPNKVEQGRLIAILLHGVDVKLDNWQSSAFLGFDKATPILRRIEDMTEEEGLVLAKLQHNPKRHKDIDVLYIKRDHLHYIDGTRWSGDGVSEHNEFFVYFNQLKPDQFIYLIKQGFDLFSLLDTDQVIDAKTINNEKVL